MSTIATMSASNIATITRMIMTMMMAMTAMTMTTMMEMMKKMMKLMIVRPLMSVRSICICPARIVIMRKPTMTAATRIRLRLRRRCRVRVARLFGPTNRGSCCTTRTKPVRVGLKLARCAEIVRPARASNSTRHCIAPRFEADRRRSRWSVRVRNRCRLR